MRNSVIKRARLTRGESNEIIPLVISKVVYTRVYKRVYPPPPPPLPLPRSFRHTVKN